MAEGEGTAPGGAPSGEEGQGVFRAQAVGEPRERGVACRFLARETADGAFSPAVTWMSRRNVQRLIRWGASRYASGSAGTIGNGRAIGFGLGLDLTLAGRRSRSGGGA